MSDVPSALDLSDEAFQELMDKGDMSFDEPTPVSAPLPEEVVELDNEEEVDENVEESPEDSPSDDGVTPDSEDLPEDTEADSDAESVDDTNLDEEDGDVRDYQAELEMVLAPFKANGREIQVSTPEEVRTLMQKGANYDKKMDHIKPHLRVIKMLENNKVAESDLSHLIDIYNKQPEAIAKFLTDNNMDPLDIDLEKHTEYKPNTNLVDERVVILDTVLEDLKSKPGAQTTMDILGNQWDEASKQYAYDHAAEVLPLIESHVTSGVYDKVMNVVARDKALGGLAGMSDIQAYKTVGDRMYREGAFNDPAPTATPSKKAVVDPTLRNRKKVAGSTRSAAPTQPKKVSTNYLDLSDAEFEKLENELGL